MASDILERLRHRIDVFSGTESKTEFGELTYKYEKVQTVWAEIVPKTGRENTLDGNSIQASITHKITVRNGAIKKPRNDMYFEYKGQHYEVMYFMPNYKKNNVIEFYCKLIIEGENDYGR